jgi:hypothetical protein
VVTVCVPISTPPVHSSISQRESELELWFHVSVYGSESCGEVGALTIGVETLTQDCEYLIVKLMVSPAATVCTFAGVIDTVQFPGGPPEFHVKV